MESLSLTDSSVLKGIAILMMLVHHLFSPNSIALQMKLCVAIFVFVSGYGLMKRYAEEERVKLKEFYRRRFVKLMMNYWFVFIVFIPLSALWLGPSLAQQYGSRWVGEKLVFDFLGILNWTGRYPYNPTWWFYGCIIGLYLLFPLFHRVARSSRLFLLSLAIVLYFLPLHPSCIRYYIPAFICGMIYAQEERNAHSTLTPPLWAWSLLLILSVLCRFVVDGSIQIFLDGMIVTAGVVVYKSIPRIGWLSNVFSFLGRYSMDMFLTHTFLFFLWPSTHKIVFAINNPFYIFVTGVLLSLALALVMGWIKRVIGYNRLIEKLRTI